MGRAVVHFEIMGADGEAVADYYRRLFGWEADFDNQFRYGLVDREKNTNGDDVGIGGGICTNPQGGPHLTFYVEVPDVEQALTQAEELGGTRHMGPETLQPGTTIGLFADPDGNMVGLIQEA